MNITLWIEKQIITFYLYGLFVFSLCSATCNGDDIKPIKVQSASKRVISVVAPKNLEESSKSFILNRTLDPRT